MTENTSAPLILIADDQKPTTRMLERIFTYEGYQVHVVYNGNDALASAQNLLPDLLLLDVNMPGLTGFEVLRRLRQDQRTASIPTILVTAMNETDQVVEGLNLGADDYIRKPFHYQELLARAISKMKARQFEMALQRKNRELEVLLELGQKLNRPMQLDTLFGHIREAVSTLLPGLWFAGFYCDQAQLTPLYDIASAQPSPLEWQQDPLRYTESFLWDQVEDSPFVEVPYGILGIISHDNRQYGYLMAGNLSPYDTQHLQVLDGICRQAALSIRNIEYTFHLEKVIQQRTQALESAHNMLIRSEKLASIGRLAASIAHEINNPLMPIKINLENVLEDVRDGRPLDERDFTVMLESVERIQHIVGRLKEFTGGAGAAERFQLVDINYIVQSIVLLNQKLFSQENKTLDLDLQPVPEIMGNKYQLEHVFMNLVMNAREAMTAGDRLQFSTRLDGNMLLIEAVDDGHGMSSELQTTIFEPFVTTKPGGNGLGLFITYGIIQSHQGTITVESAEGEGTIFRIRLPIPTSEVNSLPATADGTHPE